MKLFPFIFGGIGIGLLIGAFVAYNYSRKFIAKAETAQGTITKLNYHKSSRKSGGVYYPTVQFTTQAGKTYSVASNSGSNPAAYNIGESVKVYYNPEDPKDILLPDFFSVWGISLILGFIGLIFSVISGSLLYAGRKRAAKVY